MGDTRRELVDLFPQFLSRRMRGWDGMQPLLAESGLARPDMFLLRAIVMESDPGVWQSEAELRATLFNPYATVHSFVEQLPALAERGYLALSGDRYMVTPGGRALAGRIERAARAYLAALEPLPAADLARLADTLADIAGRMWAAAEPAAKPHQARVRRLPPVEGAAPLPRIDAAVYALWGARDDAHNAAWRAAGFDGPTLDLLSRVWTGEASTRASLAERVRGGQCPEDVERGLAALAARGYLSEQGGQLQLTPAGRAARDAIEAETDRVYFAPWPALGLGDLSWLHTTFQALCQRV